MVFAAVLLPVQDNETPADPDQTAAVELGAPTVGLWTGEPLQGIENLVFVVQPSPSTDAYSGGTHEAILAGWYDEVGHFKGPGLDLRFVGLQGVGLPHKERGEENLPGWSIHPQSGIQKGTIQLDERHGISSGVTA
jgi:hypothetical protein